MPHPNTEAMITPATHAEVRADDPRVVPLAKWLCKLLDDDWTPNRSWWKKQARESLTLVDGVSP